ncbi:MAG: acyl-CoA thioesterase [Rhodospirillaceae bacterium]|jgi:acyl-CoA thioester hydrolase|nr:acyl-CoA thioesterase [Rhodospirillaceae bacterium]MBT6405019.1 acyl-CoA thioesterase [Rhodospirillaceae bacterium]MBT6534659.1 acyl-CoA thioesterase [Rhodospirillaceae bacterium]MBT7361870.1 acyl-CoA thioesterase [Rhodospirillaceae bacterium]
MTDELDLTNRDVFLVWTSDTVRYGDLDPNLHVNNGAINQFFEDGRVNFRQQRLSSTDGDKLTGFAVVKFSVSYRAPAHYPGDVEIGTAVTRVGGSSYGLGQGVFQNGACVATAEVVTVHFDPETAKSRPLPDDIRAALEAAKVAPTGR